MSRVGNTVFGPPPTKQNTSTYFICYEVFSHPKNKKAVLKSSPQYMYEYVFTKPARVKLYFFETYLWYQKSRVFMRFARLWLFDGKLANDSWQESPEILPSCLSLPVLFSVHSRGGGGDWPPSSIAKNILDCNGHFPESYGWARRHKEYKRQMQR